MKHIMTSLTFVAFLTPGFAQANSCEDRRTEILIEMEAITEAQVEIEQHLKSVKASQRQSVAAEFQLDLETRASTLETEHASYVAECVK